MTETWYNVLVEAQAPAGVPARDADDAADDLMDLLAGHSGVVATGESSWRAALSVAAGDAGSAVARGAGVVAAMAARAGMPGWPFIRAEAVRHDVLAAEYESPVMPEIVSEPEAADILGVAQQRFRELAARAGFPRPAYELRTGRLWLRAAIEAYAERQPREPGRRSRREQA